MAASLLYTKCFICNIMILRRFLIILLHKAETLPSQFVSMFAATHTQQEAVMQVYIHEYQNDLALVLSEAGQVLGIYESVNEAREAYCDFIDSLDHIYCEDVCLGNAA